MVQFSLHENTFRRGSFSHTYRCIILHLGPVGSQVRPWASRSDSGAAHAGPYESYYICIYVYTHGATAGVVLATIDIDDMYLGLPGSGRFMSMPSFCSVIKALPYLCWLRE